MHGEQAARCKGGRLDSHGSGTWAVGDTASLFLEWSVDNSSASNTSDPLLRNRMSCMAQPIDRGLARMQRGGYRSTLRKRPFKRGGRAAHVSTSTAAPACGGEVGGCSGGVQRLGNLGGRAARARAG